MKYVATIIVVIVVGLAAFAGAKKISPVALGFWGTTNTEAGVALKGYDPMSYLLDNMPANGSADYTYDYADATWHFASAAHRDLFASNPEKFSPQFGGFCAFAMSKGFTADADPEVWYIERGRVYVFADANVRDQWVNGLDEGSLQRSSENWAKRD